MGLELTRVEMPPGAFVGMIGARQELLALGTRPARVGMLRPQVHALRGRVELDARNAPRRLQPENGLEEFRVLHRRPRAVGCSRWRGWLASQHASACWR